MAPPPPSVTIIEDGRVAVPPPPPPEPALFKLTALDAQWIPLPLIQRVLVFDGGEGRIPPFEDVVAALRASLAETVARLLPLAGRIVHLPETGRRRSTAPGAAAASGSSSRSAAAPTRRASPRTPTTTWR